MMETVCCVATVAGAVYRPVASMVPTPEVGLSAQVTDVIVAFTTVAVNCWVWPPDSVGVAGLTVTVIGGESVTVEVAVFVLSTWLVAVTVTVCGAAIAAGAAYNPEALMVPAPEDGLMVQVTPASLVNC